MRNRVPLKKVNLIVGETYLIGWGNIPNKKSKLAIFIHSTPKGFNFMIPEDNCLFFDNPIYRSKHKNKEIAEGYWNVHEGLGIKKVGDDLKTLTDIKQFHL